MKKFLYVCFVASIVGVLFFQAGCSLNPFGGGGSDSTNLLTPVTNGEPADVNFALVFPTKRKLAPTMSIRPDVGTSSAYVTFRLVLLNPGDVNNKSQILIQRVPVNASGEAHVSFPGMPERPVIGQISIENGSIQGYKDFQGAKDLSGGSNTVELAPAGSGMPQDILANTLQTALQDDEMFKKLPPEPVTQAQLVVNQVDLEQVSAVLEVINKFVRDVLKPASLIYLGIDFDRLKVVGYQDGEPKWQLKNTDAWAGQAAFTAGDMLAQKVLRQVFGGYGLVSWKHLTGSHFGITKIDPDGKVMAKCYNPGFCGTIFFMSTGRIIVGGTDEENHCPILFAWDGANSISSKDAEGNGLVWVRRFNKEITPTSAVPNPTVESVQYNGVDAFLVSVQDPTSGWSRFFRVNPVDGKDLDVPPPIPASTTNILPAVEITAPASGAESVLGKDVVIEANAVDVDGTVSRVEFFNGGYRMGEDTSYPYSFTWRPMASGTFMIHAVVFDNLGGVGVATSVPVKILPPTQTSIDWGDDLTFAISRGKTEMKRVFVYFSAGGQGVASETLDCQRFEDVTFKDFRIIENLNQLFIPVKLGRLTHPTFFTKYAVTRVPAFLILKPDGTEDKRFGGRFLEAGEFFDQLFAAWQNVPPQVEIASPTQGAIFKAPAAVRVLATATDTDGAVARVEFYLNGVKVGECATAPYSMYQTLDNAGAYVFSAKAYDNNGGMSFSQGVSILVKPSSEIVGNMTFFDDFSENLGKWLQVNEITGAKIEITPNDGKPFPCVALDYFNFTMGKLFLISNQTFSLQKKALNFGADIKQGNANLALQKLAAMAIVKENNGEWERIAEMAVHGSGHPDLANAVVARVRYGTASGDVEISPPLRVPTGDGWHHGNIVVRPDRRIEFLLDGQVIYLSTHAIPEITVPVRVLLGDAKSFFDNAGVEVIDLPDLPVVMQQSGIALSKVTVNGLDRALDAPVVTVAPGGAVAGSIEFMVNRMGDPATLFGVAGTLSWDDTEIADLGMNLGVGSFTKKYEFTKNAPTTPGEYYIVILAGTQNSALKILACDSDGTVGNGNDVWKWTAEQFTNAFMGNPVNGILNGANARFLARAIKIVVIDENQGPPAFGSTMNFNWINLNGKLLDRTNPVLEVAKGASIMGSFSIHLERLGPATEVFPVAGTVSWMRDTKHAIRDHVIPGSHDIPFNIVDTAPNIPGIYWIPIIAGPMSTIDELLGCDHDVSRGGPAAGIFGNLNDVWDWSLNQFGQALHGAPVEGQIDGHKGTFLARAIQVIVFDPEVAPPAFGSRIRFMGGHVNGNPLDLVPEPNFTVLPGESIIATLGVELVRNGPATVTFPLGGALSWDPAARFPLSANAALGTSTVAMGIVATAPVTPGIYWIPVITGPGANLGQLLSCDQDGTLGNGNDIWNWTEMQFSQAVHGFPIQWNFNGFQVAPIVRAIKVIVVDPNFQLPAFGSKINFTNIMLNDMVLDPAQPEMAVAPGASITGYLNVLIDRMEGVATFPVVAAIKWDRDFRQIISPSLGVGQHSFNVPIDFTAPALPGDYEIFILAGPVKAGGLAELLGCDPAIAGTPIFGNGNDVWDWALSQINQAWLGYPVEVVFGGNPRRVLARVIKIHVGSNAAPPVAAFGSIMQFNAFSHNGLPIDPYHPIIQAEAGATVTAEFDLTMERKGPALATFPVGFTFSWDNTAKRPINVNLPPGVHVIRTPLVFRAPTTTGEYWITILAGAPFRNLDELFGCDTGTFMADTTNDVWNWTQNQLGQAFDNMPVGCVVNASPSLILARAIKVQVVPAGNVEPPPVVNLPANGSIINFESVMLNGAPLDPVAPVIRVPNGGNLVGSVTLRIYRFGPNTEVFPVGYTYSWNNQVKNSIYSNLATGTWSKTITINTAVPAATGVYWIPILGGNPFTTVDELLACDVGANTDVSNDVWGWAFPQYANALSGNPVPVRVNGSDSAVLARAIKVEVGGEIPVTPIFRDHVVFTPPVDLSSTILSDVAVYIRNIDTGYTGSATMFVNAGPVAFEKSVTQTTIQGCVVLLPNLTTSVGPLVATMPFSIPIPSGARVEIVQRSTGTVLGWVVVEAPVTEIPSIQAVNNMVSGSAVPNHIPMMVSGSGFGPLDTTVTKQLKLMNGTMTVRLIGNATTNWFPGNIELNIVGVPVGTYTLGIYNAVTGALLSNTFNVFVTLPPPPLIQTINGLTEGNVVVPFGAFINVEGTNFGASMMGASPTRFLKIVDVHYATPAEVLSLPNSVTPWTNTSIPVSLEGITVAGTYEVCIYNPAGEMISNPFNITIQQGVQPPALSIVNQQITTGQVGTPFNMTLLASGGVAPYTWVVTPMGAGTEWLIHNLGMITGTPDTIATFAIQVDVTDSLGASATRNLYIAISGTGGALQITNGQVQAAEVGTMFNMTLLADGGTMPYTWQTLGTPPAWLNHTAGMVTGTPGTPGTFTFEVRVTDNLGATAVKTFYIGVTGAGGFTNGSFNGPWLMQGGSASSGMRIFYVLPDGNGNILDFGAVSMASGTYSVQTNGSFTISTLYGSDGTLDPATITGALTGPNAGVFAWGDVTGTLERVSDVGAAQGTWQGTVNVNYLDYNTSAPSSASTNVSFEVNALGQVTSVTSPQVTGLRGGHMFITPSGLAKFLIRTTNLRANPWWEFSIEGNRADGNMFGHAFVDGSSEPGVPPSFSTVALQGWVAPLSITSPDCATATVGTPFTYDMAATGGTPPYVFFASPLPAWLVATGSHLMGTPTDPGVFNINLMVTDANGATASKMMALTILPGGGGALTITSPQLANATVGSPFVYAITATGGTTPYTFMASPLPTPLVASGNLIVGTPTSTGNFNVNLMVTDADGATASQMLALSISAAGALTITSPAIATATVGTPFVYATIATGGTTPYTFMASPLPTPLVASGNLIVGTPTSTGNFNVNLMVTDADGATASQMLALNIIAGTATPTGHLFFDDFSDGTLNKWSINTDAGGSAINDGGVGNPAPGAVVASPSFLYTATGPFAVGSKYFEFKSSMKHNGDTSKYSQMFVGQMPMLPSHRYAWLRIYGTTHPTMANKVQACVVWDNGGTLTTEDSGALSIPTGLPDGDNWHCGKIVVQPDRIVKFYVEGNLVYTSTHNIPTSVTSMLVGMGEADSYYDDAWLDLLDQPSNPTLPSATAPVIINVYGQASPPANLPNNQDVPVFGSGFGPQVASATRALRLLNMTVLPPTVVREVLNTSATWSDTTVGFQLSGIAAGNYEFRMFELGNPLGISNPFGVTLFTP